MIERVPILRVPIKIRKPIQKDFCTCWGINVIDIEGDPSMIVGDRLTIEELTNFLDTVNSCINIYFSHPIQECQRKVEIVLSYGIPVTLKTNQVIPKELLEKMGKVPHSALHVPIGFLNESTRKFLEPGCSSVESLRKMMFLAKSLKIFVGVCVDYQPLLMKKLDIFEMIEMTKMLSGHIMVTFPELIDEEVYSNQSSWESIIPECVSSLKQFYEPVFQTRSWRVKDRSKREFLSSLELFVKFKKMSIHTLPDMTQSVNRTRHTALKSTSSLPLGIKTFYYVKASDNSFVENKDLEECICSRCQKSIFN